MNQILSTSMPMDDRRKRKTKEHRTTIDTGTILKIFAIILLIFGIFTIGNSVYSFYKNFTVGKQKYVEPTISMEYKTDKLILLKVTHQSNISKVEYNWNNDAPVVINGNGQSYVETEIQLPAGKNTLNVLVVDENGNESTYDKEYETESNIQFEAVEDKIKITYYSDKNIAYMTYRWDEEEETKIDINTKVLNKEIDARQGLHSLTVVVVDENNKTDKKTQKINGVSKPKVEVDLDETREHFVIRTSDEQKLQKIEIILDQDENQQYLINLENQDLNEYECVLPMALNMGENLIEVTVYNVNNVTSNTAIRYIKQ